MDWGWVVTVQQLMQALKESGQPEATVVVVGRAPADNEAGYVDFELKAVDVRVGCNVVVLEVRRA